MSSASPASQTLPSCSYESRESPGPGAYSPSSNPRGYSGKDLKTLDSGAPTAFGSGSPRSAHGTPKAAHSRDLWKAPNTPGPGSYAVSNSPNHPVVSQVVSQDPLLADPSATSLDRSSAGKNRSDLCSLHLNCCWFKAHPRARPHTHAHSHTLSHSHAHTTCRMISAACFLGLNQSTGSFGSSSGRFVHQAPSSPGPGHYNSHVAFDALKDRGWHQVRQSINISEILISRFFK